MNTLQKDEKWKSIFLELHLVNIEHHIDVFLCLVSDFKSLFDEFFFVRPCMLPRFATNCKKTYSIFAYRLELEKMA